MTRRQRQRRVLLAAVVAAVAVGGCAKRPAPPPPPPSLPPPPAGPPLVIEGRVAWTDRTPADGVVVAGFRGSGQVACRARSHDGGVFQLSCPGVDWVHVVAVPDAPGGGKIELIQDPRRYDARAEPWRGVELFAPRPKKPAL